MNKKCEIQNKTYIYGKKTFFSHEWKPGHMQYSVLRAEQQHILCEC